VGLSHILVVAELHELDLTKNALPINNIIECTWHLARKREVRVVSLWLFVTLGGTRPSLLRLFYWLTGLGQNTQVHRHLT